MKHKVLMVIPDMDMRDLILDVLEEHFEGSGIDMVIDKEETYQDAMAKCRDSEPYSLIISYLHIARHRKAPLVEEDMLGLSLFRNMPSGLKTTCGILLSPIVDNYLLSQARDLHDLSLVHQSNGWQDQICDISEQVFDRLPDGALFPRPKGAVKIKKQKKVKIDIYIDLHKDTWEIVFYGEGGQICDSKPRVLKVDLDRIRKIWVKENWVDENKGRYPIWVQMLNDIGEELVQQILKNNQEILNYYTRLSTEVGGCEHFSVRFITGEEAFSLPLEAILVPEYQAANDFWMLKAPVSRRVDVGDNKLWPLFEDLEIDEGAMQINCLIIESDVQGYIKIEDHDADLAKLDNIAIEADNLVNWLKEHKREHNIGLIERLPDKEKGKACTKENVEALLTNGEQWHLVHYAGHSFHQEKGFVFFPNNGQADMVDIQEFSKWLRMAKTRLIYLSSCQSSKVKFVREIARRGVPSAIGFRWDIDDKKAAKHAEIFYENLFKEQSLENAFLKTRQQVQKNDPQHIIWAAPVLMMQARR